jgi:hypothetical protein
MDEGVAVWLPGEKSRIIFGVFSEGGAMTLGRRHRQVVHERFFRVVKAVGTGQKTNYGRQKIHLSSIIGVHSDIRERIRTLLLIY